jgi:hypothetical protein
MSEVKIYNSLVSLITSRKWSEFDAKLAEGRVRMMSVAYTGMYAGDAAGRLEPAN